MSIITAGRNIVSGVVGTVPETTRWDFGENRERGARIAVEFGELPRSRRGILDRFGDALAVLVDKPGEWASIAHYPSRAGAWYPKRALERLGLDDYEFGVRSTSTPEGSVLWARYIGEL